MRYFCGIATKQVVIELDATIKALNYTRGSLVNSRLTTLITENLLTSHEDPVVRVQYLELLSIRTISTQKN